jgi:ribosomal protein L37E
MGDLRNCRRCGKLFVYMGNPLCRQCIDQDEELFIKVREYIEKNPKCTTMEVANALDITVEKILQFLREGKLELGKENTNMLLDCERCGRPISTGRYCSEMRRRDGEGVQGKCGAPYRASKPGKGSHVHRTQEKKVLKGINIGRCNDDIIYEDS